MPYWVVKLTQTAQGTTREIVTGFLERWEAEEFAKSFSERHKAEPGALVRYEIEESTSRPEPQTITVGTALKTVSGLISEAIGLSGGKAELKQIYEVVQKEKPKTSEPAIRGVLCTGVKKKKFVRNADKTYSLGVGEAPRKTSPAGPSFTSGAISDGKVFYPFGLDEKDLEKLVIENASHIFGAGSLFITKKKLVGSHIKKVTDGLLLDLNEKPRFWIVEVELGKHDPEDHVQKQVLGFLRALKDEKSLRSLAKVVYDYVRKSHPDLGKWYHSYFVPGFTDAGANEYEFVEDILHGECGVIIVIDYVTPELREVVSDLSLGRMVRVIEFKTFWREGQQIHMFLHHDSGQGAMIAIVKA